VISPKKLIVLLYLQSLLAAGVKHITAQPETIFVPSDSALASYAATDPSAFAALKTRAGLHAITSHIMSVTIFVWLEQPCPIQPALTLRHNHYGHQCKT